MWGQGACRNQEWELTRAQPLLLRAERVKNGNQSNREQLESSPLSQSVLRNLCLVLHPANPLPLEKQSPFIRGKWLFRGCLDASSDGDLTPPRRRGLFLWRAACPEKPP